MPRGGIKKPVGYETIWKDREGRTRIKVKVEDGKRFVDKRIVKYLEYYPGTDLAGYVIIHLDNNPLNFDKENLIKIKKEIYMFMLHHKLYFDNPKLTKTGILIATLMYENKKKGKDERLLN